MSIQWPFPFFPLLSGGSAMKVVTKNCQAGSELQIKGLQLKAQTPPPSWDNYTTARSSMHTWENAGSILNLSGRRGVSISLVLLFFCHSVSLYFWHMPSHFPFYLLLCTKKSLGKVTNPVFIALKFLGSKKRLNEHQSFPRTSLEQNYQVSPVELS